MYKILYLAIMIVVNNFNFLGRTKFVFSKVRINKWILLGISIVLLASQLFIGFKISGLLWY